MPQRPISAIIARAEIVAGRPDETVRTAARRMTEAKCGSILILEGQRLLGIFTERDLLCRVVAAGLDVERTTLAQVMTGDPDTIEADAPVAEAIRRMDEFGYRHLPVMVDGKPVGVVSIRDLPFADLAAMQPELEDRHVLAERIW